MSLESQLIKLSTRQIMHLQDVMITAGIAHATGGDWREIFRRERNKYLGLQRKIYSLFYHASWADIDGMARRLTEM